MWAEYGPTRNERARGQNSINNAQVPPLTLRIRNFLTHIQIQRGKFSLTREWQSH